MVETLVCFCSLFLLAQGAEDVDSFRLIERYGNVVHTQHSAQGLSHRKDLNEDLQQQRTLQTYQGISQGVLDNSLQSPLHKDSHLTTTLDKNMTQVIKEDYQRQQNSLKVPDYTHIHLPTAHDNFHPIQESFFPQISIYNTHKPTEFFHYQRPNIQWYPKPVNFNYHPINKDLRSSYFMIKKVQPKKKPLMNFLKSIFLPQHKQNHQAIHQHLPLIQFQLPMIHHDNYKQSMIYSPKIEGLSTEENLESYSSHDIAKSFIPQKQSEFALINNLHYSPLNVNGKSLLEQGWQPVQNEAPVPTEASNIYQQKSNIEFGQRINFHKNLPEKRLYKGEVGEEPAIN